MEGLLFPSVSLRRFGMDPHRAVEALETYLGLSFLTLFLASIRDTIS